MKSTRPICFITFGLAILVALMAFYTSCRITGTKTIETTLTFQGTIDEYSSKQPVRILINFVSSITTDALPPCVPVWTTTDSSGSFSITSHRFILLSQLNASESVSLGVAFAHQGIRFPTFEMMFFREGRRPVTLHLEIIQPKKNETFHLGILNLDMLNAKATNVQDSLIEKSVDEYLRKCSVAENLICHLKVFPLVSNCGTPGCEWVELISLPPYSWKACISKENIQKLQFAKAVTKVRQYLETDPWFMIATPREEEIYRRINAWFSGGVWWIVRR